MDRIIVSVCISVFNTEKYLGRCLDSVIAQDIEGMEIVLVNDGSTDSTARIMYEYKARYPEKRIRIIEQKNLGLARGRQTGVEHSSGEYITFLDADDYLLEGAYKTILRFMEGSRADIYEFQSVRAGRIKKSPYTGVKKSREVLKDFFEGDIPVQLWLRWYRRELFSGREFPEGYVLHEDTYVLPCLLYAADTVAYIDKPLHVYCTDNENATTNELHSQKNPLKVFGDRKTNLLAVPHVIGYIGADAIERDYAESFGFFVSKVCRYLLLADLRGISYKERLWAVRDTLFPEMTEKEIERYISANTKADSPRGCRIRLLGIRSEVMLSDLKKRPGAVMKGLKKALKRMGQRRGTGRG